MSAVPYHPDRRTFVKTGGSGAAAIAISHLAAPAVLRGAEPAAMEPVRLGHIGLGTRGGGNLISYTGQSDLAKVVAVCDVYGPHRQRGVKGSNNPDVKVYSDHRELLADPQVEAVVIATPDHWHEPMVLDAAAAGKDVYCEKGWALNMDQAKRMRAAVKKHGIILQLGHQGRQNPAAYEGKRLIEEGLLGDITLVKTGRYFNGTPERPPWRWYGTYRNYDRPDPDQVLRDTDWERWLGPAPAIDWNERHFWHWRCYWPYGTGQAGDLLSHELDYVQTVLGYGIPDRCSCTGHNARWQDDRETPDTWLANYVFEEKNCTVSFEGCMNSFRAQAPEFIGTEGRMIYNSIGQNATRFEVYGDGPAVRPYRHPKDEPNVFFAPGKEHRRPDHMAEFLTSVRTRKPTTCNEDEAFIETATYLMSVEAYRRQRQVRWDAAREEIV